jgi:DNA-directed RNA polymerase subunit K/omega
MAAQEARFINDQARLGIIKPEAKPTTTAMKRLFEGRVVENEDTEAQG